MANNTDYTRLLDGYSLLAIKNYVDTKIATRAPTSHASSGTTYGIGTSTNYGHVKLGPAQQNGATAADGVAAPNGHTHSQYLTGQTWREIKVAGTSKIASSSSTALDFLNGTHSVQFTYSSGLYAEVDLTKYKPNGSTAFLDSSTNKVSTTYLPDTVLGQLEYKGTWNATTPASIGTPEKGWYYVCATAGSKNPGGGTVSGVTYAVGDWAVYNGSSWDKVDNTDAITSIKWGTGTAKTGAVEIPYATGSVEGVIKLGTSGTTAAYGNHTHTLSLASSQATSGISEIYLNNVRRLTAGGSTLDFEIIVDAYNITTILGYVPATEDHTHTTGIITGGTSSLNMAFNTTYTLTAGGTSFAFKLPANPNSWRPVKYSSTTLNDTSTTLEFVAGSNIQMSFSSGKLTVSATDTTYGIAKYNTTGLLKPLYSNTKAVTATTAAAEVSNDVTVATRTTTAGRYYGVEIDKDGRLYVNVPWSEGTNSYPTAFAWTNGTTAGPTGSLTGSNMTAVSFGAIPSAGENQSGIVTTTTQTFKGAKTFKGSVSITQTSTGANDGDLVVDSGRITTKNLTVRTYVTVYSDGLSNVPEDGSLTWQLDDPDLDIYSTGLRIRNLTGSGSVITFAFPFSDYVLSTGGEQTFVLATRTWVGNTYIAKSLTSAKGDMIYASAANTPARLAIGSNGQFLSVNSSGIPAWKSHAVSIATSSGTNQITLAYGTKYAITVNGASYVFTMPASDNTNYYPTAFSWTNGTGSGPTGSLTGTGMSAVSFPAIPAASDSQSGVVIVGAQSFFGEKTLDGQLNIEDSHFTQETLLNVTGHAEVNSLTIWGGDSTPDRQHQYPSLNLEEGGYIKINNSDDSEWAYLYYDSTYAFEQDSDYDEQGVGDYIHPVNVHTYSQQEATNILNGLNSDGTNI